MNRKIHWLLAVVVTSLLQGCDGLMSKLVTLPEFKSKDQINERWYHRIDRNSWVQIGADLTTIQLVLDRIETADGERWDADLVDTVIKNGSGNWIFEWSKEAAIAAKLGQEAESAGHFDQALKYYREALAYYLVGSSPHLGLEVDRVALQSARDMYLAAAELLPGTIDYVEFPVSGSTTRGILHRPTKSEDAPILVLTYGSDVSKEEALAFYIDELLPRGIALLSVDLPGLGDSSHLKLHHGSDRVLVGATTFAKQLDWVNYDQIFIAGISFGGNAAARFFLTQKAAGVVYMCGPIHRAFKAPAEMLDKNLPKLTLDGVKARIGILGRSTAEAMKLAKLLSLKDQGLVEGAKDIETPLLVINTRNDPVAPLSDVEMITARATHVDEMYVDTVGHCPERRLRRGVMASWIDARINQIGVTAQS